MQIPWSVSIFCLNLKASNSKNILQYGPLYPLKDLYDFVRAGNGSTPTVVKEEIEQRSHC